MDIDCDTLFEIRDMRTRNNGLTLHKAKFSNNVERYIFKNRCVSIWNMLPQNVVGSKEPSVFINRLNSIDLGSIILKASIST